MNLFTDIRRAPNLKAVLCGVALFVVLSLFRQASQPLLRVQFLAILATTLVYLVPGAVVGVIAKQAWLSSAAILSAVAGMFVAWQALLFHVPMKAAPIFLEMAGTLTAVGLVAIGLGAMLGRSLFVRMSSN